MRESLPGERSGFGRCFSAGAFIRSRVVMTKRFVRHFAIALAAVLSVQTFLEIPPVRAADATARDISVAIAKLKPGETLSYVDADLSLLDLAALDLSGADLTGADLYGTDLTGARLVGAKLPDTRLDRAVLIRTDLSKADLTGATLILISTYTTVHTQRAEAPIFREANLAGARVLARLEAADFRDADLSDADFSALMPGTATIASVPKNYLSGADFSGANLTGADFTQAKLEFARFIDADLTGAVFKGADLRGADFTGAKIRDADFSGAQMEGARLSGAVGKVSSNANAGN